MEIETETVLVPIGGLQVTLPPGKFAKWHSIHPKTAAPNRVKVTNSTVNGFTLQVYFQAPGQRKAGFQVMKDAEGQDRKIPTNQIVDSPQVPVEAEVSYRITGE